MTSKSLKNYGIFFEKQLPLHKLGILQKYSFKNDSDSNTDARKKLLYRKLRKKLIEERPLSTLIAQLIAQMSEKEDQKNKQIIINEHFSNVVRLEEKILYWNSFD